MRNQAGLVPMDAQRCIEEFGRFVQSSIDAEFPSLWAERRAEFQALFERVGDMAYGKFNLLLFQPVHSAARKNGMKCVPRLPGSFQSSREWGNHDESHQQRWFTCRVTGSNGRPLGTLGVGVHHDHGSFRLPRTPEVVAMKALAPKEVVSKLTALHPEYGAAPEFRDWYAQHIQSAQQLEI